MRIPVTSPATPVPENATRVVLRVPCPPLARPDDPALAPADPVEAPALSAAEQPAPPPLREVCATFVATPIAPAADAPEYLALDVPLDVVTLDAVDTPVLLVEPTSDPIALDETAEPTPPSDLTE